MIGANILMKNKMMKVAIEFKNIYYKYPKTKTWVLRNINFRIPWNSFYVITGPTGCGKTTLLTLTRGFLKEYGGEFKGDIYIFNQNIKDSDVGILGSKIGIIFQHPSTQLHQLKVIDEIMSAPMYQGLPWQECKKRAKAVAEQILDPSFYNRNPNELSYGEQQKAALAACLSMRCEILLLDEPFSFLDPKAAKEILDILLKLQKRGKTIVLATHDLEQVSGHADRIALMDNGGFLLEGRTKEVLYSNELEETLTSPVSIRVAKALIEEGKLEEKVANWQSLLKRIKINSVSQKVIKNEVNQDVILKLNNISYTYPDSTKGVKNISLDIYKGEILGVIGANGSGKTTLAKLILGLLKPDEGGIYLFGNKITNIEISERAKKIGYITQDPVEMLFGDTVLQECAFGPKSLGLKNPAQLAKETLNELGLLRYKEEHPDSLSGGEKRLLTIADILVNKTQILILDEPEFGLDPKTWRSIANTIRKLKKEGKTIILITHNIEVTIFLCDRVAVMSKGKILKVRNPIVLYTDSGFLQNNNLPYLPLFKTLKAMARDKKPLSEKNFIDTLVSSAKGTK